MPSIFEVQPDEPDPRTLARREHPDTSHEAAHAVVDQLASLQQWAADCVALSPGLTARELAEIYCPTDPKRIDRRLTECAQRNLIRRGKPRPSRGTNRNATTWWPAGTPDEVAGPEPEPKTSRQALATR